jgi:hypothetical protein
MWFSRFLAELLEALNLVLAAVIVSGGYLGYREAALDRREPDVWRGDGRGRGLIVAALVCGLIANLSLIEQHLALIADDIEEMRARDAANEDEKKRRLESRLFQFGFPRSAERHDLDFDAAVLCAAGFRRIVGDRPAFAEALRDQTLRADAAGSGNWTPNWRGAATAPGCSCPSRSNRCGRTR